MIHPSAKDQGLLSREQAQAQRFLSHIIQADKLGMPLKEQARLQALWADAKTAEDRIWVVNKIATWIAGHLEGRIRT